MGDVNICCTDDQVSPGFDWLRSRAVVLIVCGIDAMCKVINPCIGDVGESTRPAAHDSAPETEANLSRLPAGSQTLKIQ